MSRTSSDLHHATYFDNPTEADWLDYCLWAEATGQDVELPDDLAREFAAAAECARVADERAAKPFDSFEELLADAERPHCICGETLEDWTLCDECAASFAADQNQETKHVS